MSDSYVHALVHENQLIGIIKLENGFDFEIHHLLYSCVYPNSDKGYSDLETALSAAIKRAEFEKQRAEGSASFVRRKPLPKTANAGFKKGWKEARGFEEGEWNKGYESFLRREPLLKTAPADFRKGWKQSRGLHGEVEPDAA